MELATLYRDIVEKSPDAIWVFDLEGRIVYANPALRELFGGTEEQMHGLTVFDTLDGLASREVMEEVLARDMLELFRRSARS